MFKKIIFGLLVSVSLATVVTAKQLKPKSTPTDYKTVIFEAKSATSTVYIMGSIHFATKDFYPLPAAVMDAYNKSDALVVEVNVNSPENKQAQMKMMSQFIYPQGDSLKKHLNKKVFDMLANYLNNNGMPAEKLLQFKPGFLAMMLTARKLMQLGFSPLYGIDYFFLTQAKGKKKILELETVESQMKLFLKIKDPNKFVKYTVTDMEQIEEIMDSTIKAWKSGNTKELNKLLIEDLLKKDPSATEIMDDFIFKRNIEMTEKIEGYLKTSMTYFVVVGAGHLVGPKGIINLLKKKNIYKIKQM